MSGRESEKTPKKKIRGTHFIIRKTEDRKIEHIECGDRRSVLHKDESTLKEEPCLDYNVEENKENRNVSFSNVKKEEVKYEPHVEYNNYEGDEINLSNENNILSKGRPSVVKSEEQLRHADEEIQVRVEIQPDQPANVSPAKKICGKRRMDQVEAECGISSQLNISSKRVDLEFDLKCDVCQFSSDNPSELDNHYHSADHCYKIEHNPELKFKCTFCPLKEYSNWFKFRNHINSEGHKQRVSNCFDKRIKHSVEISYSPRYSPSSPGYELNSLGYEPSSPGYEPCSPGSGPSSLDFKSYSPT